MARCLINQEQGQIYLIFETLFAGNLLLGFSLPKQLRDFWLLKSLPVRSVVCRYGHVSVEKIAVL
jgi:hypothetical protein